jgi:hypothetical protein
MARSSPGSRCSVERRPHPMKVDAVRKIGYSFIGVLAGNAASLIALILVSVLKRTPVLHNLPRGWQLSPPAVFVVFAAISFRGWAVAGLPAVLLLPARAASQFPWPLFTALGILLRPLALFVLFLSLAGGRIDAITDRQALPARHIRANMFELLGSLLHIGSMEPWCSGALRCCLE